MDPEIEAYWAALPRKTEHPIRVPIVEALRCIGEPLSAVMLVDVLEGEVTMWEAGAHLDALVKLGVARRGQRDPASRQPRADHFDVLFSLDPQGPAQ